MKHSLGNRLLGVALGTGLLAVAPLFSMAHLSAQDRPDVIFADFNGSTYAPWTAEGEAFGEGPVKGGFSYQMEVTGFEGEGLVDSFLNGDTSTGKLISPEFTIERPYLNFLIGGGGFQDSVYMALFVEGEEVLRATGTNIEAGGSEKLAPFYWDLTPYAGKTARIEIVDAATGGWGHINVDALVFSDKPNGKKYTYVSLTDLTKDLTVEKPYLLIPAAREGKRVFVRIEKTDGENAEKIQDIQITLPESEKEIFFYSTVDMTPWLGKNIRLVAEQVSADIGALDWVKQSDKIADFDTAYNEKYRPQFHFSPRRGWTNDPNGLMWYNGTYHLFFQHNPFGTNWGNMTWGHATSTDLFHWKEGADALRRDDLGTIFSGSGVVDYENTSGLAPEGNEFPPLVVFYTCDGPEARPPKPVTQSMAYSLDAGKTWTKYPKNPVVPNIIGANRDPKVIWYEPARSWIMALYLDGEDYALLRSKNLTDWEVIDRIEKLGCSECPDIFELAVDGNEQNKKWVFWGGNGNYLIGSFNGEKFTKEAGPFVSKYGGNDYAAQTFFGLPDGRRIQFSWMNGGVYPDMPFNQQFSVPRELTLKTTADGIRLAFYPAQELNDLRGEVIVSESTETGEAVIAESIPECFDAEMTLDVSKANRVKIGFSGTEIDYDVKAGLLNGAAPITAEDGKVTIRLVVDRMSYEIFANGGITEFAQCFIPTDTARAAAQAGKGVFVISTSEGDLVTVESLTIWPIQKTMEK